MAIAQAGEGKFGESAKFDCELWMTEARRFKSWGIVRGMSRLGLPTLPISFPYSTIQNPHSYGGFSFGRH
jgi:hypothetical protein